MIRQIIYLIRKEIQIEWRNRYALNGILLYLVSTIFMCYISFNVRVNQLNPVTWNVIYWIIILFTAVNAVAKSFIQDNEGSFLYLFWLHSPASIILSKSLYNALLLTMLGFVGFAAYSLVLGNPVEDKPLFFGLIVLACFGLSFTLTMVSAIASKARNSHTLMSILSFPIILPILLMVIKTSKNAMAGVDLGASADEMLVLGAINAMVAAASYLLFPYLWRT